MNLIKAEFRKTLTEAISYYPDYIVGLITDFFVLIIVINTEGNTTEKVFGYILWILASGVISEASMCISTEKQLGTLQNIMIKPYSIAQIVTVKTIVWFSINVIKAIITMVVAMIFFGYIPLIIKGVNPILASLGISIPVVIITLIIISGRNIKTLVAIIGTTLGVVISGILAFIFGNFAHLTGLADDSSISLAYIPQFRNLDYKGILFGTILIGAIGAIMDVAISIASALYEINELDSNISKKNMIISGMNIGKDMMGSMSNTLILAYVGTTLHLIILFIVYKIRFVEIINLDSIATEIIRAMAGSIGLIITIPVTVVIGTAIYKKKTP